MKTLKSIFSKMSLLIIVSFLFSLILLISGNIVLSCSPGDLRCSNPSLLENTNMLCILFIVFLVISSALSKIYKKIEKKERNSFDKKLSPFWIILTGSFITATILFLTLMKISTYCPPGASCAALAGPDRTITIFCVMWIIIFFLFLGLFEMYKQLWKLTKNVLKK
jgi:hypothetical protein